ncbi:hypothetical protein [Williamsia serinedens]|uniref:hypothetical protein n=1 Tax=Williamsia serinedens TaxID=391736 RepID=UPI0019E4B05E|nr:hypothetical protein [Williamsia serinedens]MBE7195333.1 hypothetical protein [Gordonia polyisoprenivorans]
MSTPQKSMSAPTVWFGYICMVVGLAAFGLTVWRFARGDDVTAIVWLVVMVAGFATSAVILRRAVLTNGSIAPAARPNAEQLAEYDARWHHPDSAPASGDVR